MNVFGLFANVVVWFKYDGHLLNASACFCASFVFQVQFLFNAVSSFI